MRLLKVGLILEFANVFVSSLIQNVFSSIKLLRIFLATRKGKVVEKKKILVQIFRHIRRLLNNPSATNMITNHLSFVFMA